MSQKRNDIPQTRHNSPKQITICLMQSMLLNKRSSNGDLTWMFFPFERKLLEVPKICVCTVGVLRCTADWDTDHKWWVGYCWHLQTSEQEAMCHKATHPRIKTGLCMCGRIVTRANTVMWSCVAKKHYYVGGKKLTCSYTPGNSSSLLLKLPPVEAD